MPTSDDRAHVCVPECAPNSHVAFRGRKLIEEMTRELAEARERANLSLATTRELLAELQARGEVDGGENGAWLATLARWLLDGISLPVEVLDYRPPGSRAAPSLGDPAAAGVQRFFTGPGCVTGQCQHRDANDALLCNARPF